MNNAEKKHLSDRISERNNQADPFLPELGYTPANLRFLRKFYHLTQKELAHLTQSALRSVQNWEAEPEISSSHRAMPLDKWRLLLNELDIKEARK